jgi:hypothetical protein
MTSEHKKAILIFGVGILLFMVFKPKMKRVNATTNLKVTDKEDDPKDRKKMSTPTMSKQDAQANPLAKNGFAALKAYIDAYNNGEPQSVLDELNREFAKEFKVKVYRRKSDGKLVVCDLNGKEIMVNN